MSEWMTILKSLDMYAKQRIEDLNKELEHNTDKELEKVIVNQLAYWKEILSK